jgi:CRISPR-associated protein Csd1
MEHILDEIIAAFSHDDSKESFVNDNPLSGEFLLGYHCQRQSLRSYEKPEDLDATNITAQEI